MPSTVLPALPRTVGATRYVTPLREGGSLPGLVEADDDGLYVLKFRGAGQGPKALVAEYVVGELGRAVGLPVPEVVLIALDPSLGDAEPDPEIHDLIRASGGINVGLDFLPGALPFSPAAGPTPEPDLAADIAWFDALVTNPDRTVQNPNLLTWHGRLWLIDHGAALYIHHTWRDPSEHARRPFGRIRDHVLVPYASSIAAADERLVARLDEGVVRAIVDGVPDDWLAPEPSLGSVAAVRAAYVAYLLRRLAAPRPFVEEADRARAA
jgi:hypothetical protein